MMLIYKVENGKYNLYNNQKLVIKEQEEISLLFSKEVVNKEEEYILHKHGIKEIVEDFFNKNNKFFNVIGSDLIMYTGKFTEDDLNKIINCTGYSTIFVNNIKLNQIETIK